ncbi:MAG: cysteine desulfuration protein SufE [Rhodobiaceae bacterium]|nr:cysteine desulfuration protein SufE [Rhodobiaceae bacterium]
MSFNNIIDDFEFLENWEDKYKYIIDMGGSLAALKSNDYNDDNKVEGCASQVWLVVEENIKQGKTILKFKGDSDAYIVKGLIAIIFALFSEKTPSEILEIDPMSELKKLNLEENISQQRSNGLTAMINRVFSEAKKRI